MCIRDSRKDPVACKKITAYIPDNPDLYEHLTGMQYLGFIADLFGVPGPCLLYTSRCV